MARPQNLPLCVDRTNRLIALRMGGTSRQRRQQGHVSRFADRPRVVRDPGESRTTASHCLVRVLNRFHEGTREIARASRLEKMNLV